MIFHVKHVSLLFFTATIVLTGCGNRSAEKEIEKKPAALFYFAYV